MSLLAPVLAHRRPLTDYGLEDRLNEIANRTVFTGRFVGPLASGTSGERVLVGPSPLNVGQFGAYLFTGEPEEVDPAVIVTEAVGTDGTTKRLRLKLTNPTQDSAAADRATIAIGSETEDATGTAEVLLFVSSDHQIHLNGDGHIVIESPASGEVQVYTDNSIRFKVDDDATSAVYVWADGSLKQVTAGANDSGGSGFKVLRVPN